MSDFSDIPPLKVRVVLDPAEVLAGLDALKAAFEETAASARSAFATAGAEISTSAEASFTKVAESAKVSAAEVGAAYKEASLSTIATSEAGAVGVAGGASKAKTAWAVAGAAIIGVSVDMAGKFQQNTNVLVTAAGETTKNLALVRQGILDISTSTGTSWQQVTDGMYLLEKAGYRGADALKVETAAAQGAREENANLSTVTQAMTSMMASYHLPASDAVQVMNEMKTAAGESKTTMEQFAGSLSTVLPLASANKVNFADLGGVLATLTQHGTSADEATQEMANSLRNLSAPNNVAVKEMAQLGISSVDVSQKLGDGPGGRGFAGTLNYLSQTVLQKMGPAGTVLLNTFNQSKTAAQDADTMLNALPASLQKLAQSYRDGTITLSDWRASLKGLPADQAALGAQWATTENQAKGFQSTLRQGLSQNQTYTDAIKKMTGGANGLNVVLQTTGESMAGTNERIKAISDSADGAGKNVSGWESTQKLFNVQLGKLKQTAEEVGIKVGTTMLPALTVMVGGLKDALQVMQSLGPVFPIVVGALAGLGVAVFTVSKAMKAWKEAMIVLNAVMDANGFVLLALAVVAIGVALYEAYQHSKTFRDIINSIANFFKTVFVDAVHAAKAVWHSLQDAFDASLAWFKDFPKHIKNALGDLGHLLLSTGSDLLNGLWSGAKTAFVDLGKWISEIPNAILFAMGFQIGLLYRVGSDIISGLWNGIKVIWEGNVHFWTDLPGNIVSFFTDAVHWLEHAGSDVISGLWSMIKTGWSNEVHFWTDLPGNIANFFSDSVHWLSKEGSNIISGLWSMIKTGWHNEVHFWTDLPGNIKNFFSDAIHWLEQVGKDIIQGLINGVGSMGDAITKKAKDLGKSFVDGITSSLGVKSPSTVMHAIGINLGEGLANGIDASMPTVMGRAQMMARNVAGSMSGINVGMAGMRGVSASGAVSSSTVNRNYTIHAYNSPGDSGSIASSLRKMELVYG